jgi:hypothetical protein
LPTISNSNENHQSCSPHKKESFKICPHSAPIFEFCFSTILFALRARGIRINFYNPVPWHAFTHYFLSHISVDLVRSHSMTLSIGYIRL